jgi:DNA primase catalytic subunit
MKSALRILSPLARALWNLSRKHFRIETINGRFIKLNKFENRLNEKDLKYYCYKLKATHVYFSVLNWLFPERVGKKYKARYCIPLNGEYVVDVDSYLMLFHHQHKLSVEWDVCELCLNMSKKLTLQLSEALKKYYSKFAVVFSGRAGFHVHVLDFDYRDWVSYREKDPIWCHHASRFNLTKLLQKQTHVFNHAHFNVSVDPMRVVTVPNTVNAQSGLICSYLGDLKTFEKLTITQILDKSKNFSKFHRYPRLRSYPESLESLKERGGTGVMKKGAKNKAE